jgi:hypothetical protein
MTVDLGADNRHFSIEVGDQSLPLNKSGHDGPDLEFIIGVHLSGLNIGIIP